MSDTGTVTPWTTAIPYASGFPFWVPEADQQRVQAYNVYNNMYWSEDRATPLVRNSEDGTPIYLPKPKVIVDTTAHYLLKGLTIDVADPETDRAKALFWKRFSAREALIAKFEIAKLKGVALGDWLLHITADPDKDAGGRVSITTIDPGAYFPEYDPDDEVTVLGQRVVEQWVDPNNPTKTLVKILRYWFGDSEGELTSKKSLVWRSEVIWEAQGWNNPKEARRYKVLLEPAPLSPDIRQLPIYHFKNAEWDGYDFGNSELKGVERVFQAMNQAISDEEIALALVGLGVYATDAGRPIGTDGRERDWIIAPGAVLEVPGATMIKRLEGITSVTPVQDHLKFLDMALKEGTHTSDVALGIIDAQTAESGIALAIRFIPTLAKVEYRDQSGIAKLQQFLYDLQSWFRVYEGFDFGDTELVPRLGEKLPINRVNTFNELNQMYDRGLISGEFYRSEIERVLGYKFPTGIAAKILEEKKELLELAAEFGPGAQDTGPGSGDPNANDANNKDKVNESNGTEAK